MELLHHSSPPPPPAAGVEIEAKRQHRVVEMPYIHREYERLDCAVPAFPSDAGWIERAAWYSVFAIGGRVEEEEEEEEEKECSVLLGESEAKVKSEPTDASENPNSMSESTDCKVEKRMKRKEREKKVKSSSKKSRTDNSDDGEKLPYVHVRARRGQATDSHSLAERARRGKINARMKLLQELVPGCNKIIEKDGAYAVDGDVYFSVDRFQDYGKLSGHKVEDNRVGECVAVDSRKRNPADFALLKAAKPGEPSWESPWGPGRPGWHIECCAMSAQYLTPSFDVHGGGQDLIFPHHENELRKVARHVKRLT